MTSNASFLGFHPPQILFINISFQFLFLEVYLHRVNLLNFLFRVLFVSFISYDTLNKVCMYVCMFKTGKLAVIVVEDFIHFLQTAEV